MPRFFEHGRAKLFAGHTVSSPLSWSDSDEAAAEQTNSVSIAGVLKMPNIVWLLIVHETGEPSPSRTI